MGSKLGFPSFWETTDFLVAFNVESTKPRVWPTTDFLRDAFEVSRSSVRRDTLFCRVALPGLQPHQPTLYFGSPISISPTLQFAVKCRFAMPLALPPVGLALIVILQRVKYNPHLDLGVASYLLLFCMLDFRETARLGSAPVWR